LEFNPKPIDGKSLYSVSLNIRRTIENNRFLNEKSAIIRKICVISVPVCFAALAAF
jgi:hypothetical protein